MATPTKAELGKAKWLAEMINSMEPKTFRRIWLTDWREGWRLVYDTIHVAHCRNQCKSCPMQSILIRGVSGSNFLVIKTDLFAWVSRKDKSLYGPERFLACKTSLRFAQCFVACMTKDPDYRDEDKLFEELSFVRDTRLVFDYREESFRDVELEFRQWIVQETLKRSDTMQWKRTERALIRLGWNGYDFK